MSGSVALGNGMVVNAIWLQGALAFFLLLTLAAVALLPMMRRRERMDLRIRAVATGVAERNPVGPVADVESWKPLRALGRAVVASGLLSGRSLNDLEQTMNTINASATRTNSTLPLFVGAKVALMFALPAIVYALMTVLHMTIHPTILPIAIAMGIGMLVPDAVVRHMRKKYLKALENGLPDALDLLIICTEAGLALEAGFERVSVELAAGNVPAARELRITASEMKILNDRRRALMNMGTRTGLEAMARLGGTLAQTVQYGTPVSQALRVLAAEMRQLTLTRFEEKAGRLPVMLTIPMILFILPCIFLIVGGPAAVGVMQTMGHK